MDEQANTEIKQEPEQEQDTRTGAEKEYDRAMEELKRLREDIERSNEIIKTGKGRLRLEKPIKARDKQIDELAYDFTELTGMEYTEAMDNGLQSNNVYTITYRQALCLFAKAAEKQTPDVDSQDIISQIGMTDSLEGVQLATIFFNASTRAGRQRISKR